MSITAYLVTSNSTFCSKAQPALQLFIKALHNWFFMRGIHQWLDSPQKGPVLWNAFQCHCLSISEMSVAVQIGARASQIIMLTLKEYQVGRC